MNIPQKTALIIGHPGHELRAYKFLKDYRPDVYILTDGSGAVNESRLYQSIRIIKQSGSRFMDTFSSFSDKELYNIILEKRTDKIVEVKNNLQKLVIEHGYEMIVGDALEGFNPTHDICRYMINGIVQTIQGIGKNTILNYDFLLDESPNNISAEDNINGFSLNLSKEDFEEKLIAAENYPELKYEVEYAIQRFGRDSFLWESFRKVTELKKMVSWDTKVPYYESFGKKRVEEGLYKDLITFENHIQPIARGLLDA